MAKPSFAITSSALLQVAIWILLFALANFSCANSARILDEVDPPAATLPSGQTPDVVAAVPTATEDEVADPPLHEAEDPATGAAPVADVDTPDSDVAAPDADVEAPDTDVAPVVISPPVSSTAAAPVVATTTSGVAGKPAGPQTGPVTPAPLSFYLHDIIGGSHPSSRVVTGIIARTDINGIPFSQPNNNIFPLQGGTPLFNLNSLINPNTAPFITGLNVNGIRPTTTVLQNTANNNNAVNPSNQPFVTAGNLPAGSSLQKLMFGSITVIDDELTEGHELGSAVVGRAQGFYLASSLDGTSQTIAVTVIFHGDGHGDVEDMISLFGVHRTASPESQIAVVGGTGKYEGARGYATVESVHQEDQHVTDGVDTILHFNVYLF